MRDANRTYPAPWQGQVVLACRKCQKKLKGHASLKALAKLKKTMKRQNKSHPGHELEVIQVGCMDLCPKDGVTVCVPGKDAGRLRILWSEKDVERMGR